MIRLLVGILAFVINQVYRDRPMPRFYVLETVARVPYFSYLSVLHLYETLGFWRKADWLKVHFAESWNELHHLLIMEELGGSQNRVDRVLARSTALIYYWIVVGVYVVHPKAAYNFMAEQAFDDQCTGANPRYPLIEDLKSLYIQAYEGEQAARSIQDNVLVTQLTQ